MGRAAEVLTTIQYHTSVSHEVKINTPQHFSSPESLFVITVLKETFKSVESQLKVFFPKQKNAWRPVMIKRYMGRGVVSPPPANIKSSYRH